MTDVLVLVYCRQAVQVLRIVSTIPYIGVDGHVTHPERCQVLEEVGSLAGVDAEVLQS